MAFCLQLCKIQIEVETLKGNGPCDLTEISVSLAAKLLELAGKGTFDECKAIAISKINDGSALEKLCEMVSLQGGDAEYIRNTELFDEAEYIYNVIMPESGYIVRMDTQGIGSVCVSRYRCRFGFVDNRHVE